MFTVKINIACEASGHARCERSAKEHSGVDMRTDQDDAETLARIQREMLRHASDLAVLSDDDNHNAQVAAKSIGAWAQQLDAAIAALRRQPGTWQPITTEMDDGWFIVTNNVRACNRSDGLKSHVWLTDFVQASSAEQGEFICFDAGDRCVRGLTHYQRITLQPLPAAPSPTSDPTEA